MPDLPRPLDNSPQHMSQSVLNQIHVGRDIHIRDMTQHLGLTYIFHLAQAGSASKFSGTIEAFLEEYLITETELGTVPFGGRNEDVSLLDTWLDDETAPPRSLLTAPASRGKSALLVRWL